MSEIYPGYDPEFFKYTYDVDKAKALLKEAGLENGFKTTLGYRTGDEIEEQIAVILKTNFAKAGIDVELQKMPSSNRSWTSIPRARSLCTSCAIWRSFRTRPMSPIFG